MGGTLPTPWPWRTVASFDCASASLWRAQDDRFRDDRAKSGAPKTRGECANVSRPFPYVSCKYHLYIDVNPNTGSIKINFPDKEVWELDQGCALDVAQQGGITLEEVGEILNLTRERIRQVEVRGLMQLKETGGDRAAGVPGQEPGPIAGARTRPPTIAVGLP